MKKFCSLFLALLLILTSLLTLAACQHQHTFGDWVITEEPTCLTRGTEAHYCTECEYAETRSASSLGHDFLTASTATCAATGEETETCMRDGCGFVRISFAPKEPDKHLWSEWFIALDTSCEEIGVEIRVCLHNQEHNETRAIAATGHDWNGWVTQEPDCISSGLTARDCENDHDHIESETLPATGHTWGAWSRTAQPTCTSTGQEERSCTVCGETGSQSVPALGHSVASWTKTTPEACSSAGEESGTCATCSATVTRPVSALGHTYGGWTAYSSADCTDPGTDQRTCSRDGCGYVDYRFTDPLGHNVTTWTPTVPATCTETGSESGTCTRCSGSVSNTIPKTAHPYGDWVNTAQPTCTQAGVDTRSCTVCPHSETRGGAPALGHDYGSWSVTTPSTCTTEGTERRRCSRCYEYDYQPSALNPDTHEYGNWSDLFAPLCDVGGAQAQLCEHHLLSAKTRVINPPGHNVLWEITVQPEEGGYGEAHGVCQTEDCLYEKTLPYSTESAGEITYTLINYGTEYEVTDGSGDLVIPCFYNGKPVTSINFSYHTTAHITSIVVPPTITEIKRNAFSYMGRLESITLPDTITKIGYEAFYNCRSLESITLSSNLNFIDGSAFKDCTAITSITISGNITTIGQGAFTNWTSGQTIYVVGLADQAAADKKWGTPWRYQCNATIVYQG